MRRLRECPACGAGRSERAFVRYEPDPNETQAETDWGTDLEAVHIVVCQECGEEVGLVVHRDTDRDSDGESDFKVDDELR